MSSIGNPVETFRVGLLITEQCNVACGHCWFRCGPDKTARMERDEALDYIDQAREIPTVEWISFTGGEPFLLPEMLRELVSYASERGLQTECVTNCFWASSEGEAERRLGGLVDDGLDVINISADDFHQRHIPFERVRNCYRAARHLGLRIVIMSAIARTSKLGARKVAELLGDEGIRIVGGFEQRGPPSALAVESAFIPVGRAEEIPKDELIINDGPLEGPCRVVLKDIAITSSGRVLPCCTGAGLAEAAEVGNVRQDRLRRLIEEASRRRVFRILSMEGPMGLERLLGSMRRRKNHVNKCHFCYDVLTDSCLRRPL